MTTTIRLLALALLVAAGSAVEQTTSPLLRHQVNHVVFFKWKAGVTPEQEADIGAKLVALKERVPGIISISFGHQNSPEASTLGKGFNAGLTVTFVDAAARDAYAPNPDHQQVVTVLKTMLDDLVVLDYDLPAISGGTAVFSKESVLAEIERMIAMLDDPKKSREFIERYAIRAELDAGVRTEVDGIEGMAGRFNSEGKREALQNVLKQVKTQTPTLDEGNRTIAFPGDNQRLTFVLIDGQWYIKDH